MILLFLLRSGNYGDAVTVETLKDFHRERVQILANSGADLIAFETTPNKIEAKVDAISLSCAYVKHNMFKAFHAPLLSKCHMHLELGSCLFIDGENITHEGVSVMFRLEHGKFHSGFG